MSGGSTSHTCHGDTGITYGNLNGTVHIGAGALSTGTDDCTGYKGLQQLQMKKLDNIQIPVGVVPISSLQGLPILNLQTGKICAIGSYVNSKGVVTPFEPGCGL